MNIIEKLGIVPAPWEVKRPNHADLVVLPKKAMLGDGRYYFCFGGTSDVAEREAHLNIVATAPEMLQVLIEDCLEYEEFYKRQGYKLQDLLLEYGEDGVQEYKSFMRKVKVIEKATNKTWEEIKSI